MTRVTLLDLETAPESTHPLLENALKNSGYIPNLLRVLANAPVAIETYVTVSAINARAGLDAAEREVVQLIAATTHGCSFCVAGHTALAQNRVRMAPDVIEALRASTTLPDARLEALAQFTSDVIASRGHVSDAEFKAFQAAGFTDANALEVILGVSLATLCNFANSFAGTPLNRELENYRWAPAAIAV